MNILSFICILLLILYLMVALSFTEKKEGRRLFRMVYSAISLGLLCTVFYFVFESIMVDFSDYIDPSQNVLRNAYAYFMLLIPVHIGLVLLNLVLKKKKPVLLLILSAALSVASTAVIILYSYIVDKNFSNSSSSLFEFSVLYLPFLFYFSVSGLIGTDKKWERVLQNSSMYLNLAVMIGYLIYIGITSYLSFVEIGVAGLLPFIPFVLVWILIPVVPILVYNHFRTKDAIRNGEPLKGKLRIRIKKRSKDTK